MADQFDTGGDRRQATVQCPSLSHLWPLWGAVIERRERRKEVLSEEVELNSTGIAQDIYRHFIA